MIETKYSMGDKVKHFTGIEGMIVAIFHRGKNTYEMSYCHDGELMSRIVEECEISLTINGPIGFKKERR